MAHQSAAAPATSLQDLNDDVLRETFKYLGVYDLGVIADVCSSFKRIAQEEYGRRKETNLRRPPLKPIFHVIRNFEHSLLSIVIDETVSANRETKITKNIAAN